MVTNKVKNNFIYQIIYRILTILTPLITSPILSRALGAEKLGLFSATLAFVSYFQLISMLGVENYGNRSIAAVQCDRSAQQKLFWNIYAVQVLSSLLAITLYALMFIKMPKDRILISVLQGLWLLGSLLNINWFFFGIEQFKLTVTRNIIVKILTVVLIVLFVKKPADIYKYVVIMAGDTVLSNLMVWPFLHRYIGFEEPSFCLIKVHIGPILVLFIPILAMSVFHVMDKTMLDWLSTETDVGYYYSADKVINIPLMMITALGTVMLPRVSNEYSKGNEMGVKSMLRKSTELTFFMTCAVGIGIASIANEFVPWFFGPGFESCIVLVYWFVPILFVKAIGDLVRTQYMIPAKMDRMFTLAVCIGAGVNLVANYLLIRKYGALGAVLGTLIAEFAVSIFELVCTKRKIDFGRYILENTVYLIPSLGMFFVVRLVADYVQLSTTIKLVCMIIAGAVVFMMGTLALCLIRKHSVFRNEFDVIKHI